VIRCASRDPRLAGHPGVARYGIESYIAVPLRLRDERCFGTLCALDLLPCEIEDAHLANMELLAELIAFELEASAARERERARAESALNEAEQRLRIAVAAAGIAVWDWNIDTDEVVWTERLREASGTVPGEFTGTYASFRRFVHPEDADRVEARIREAIAGSSDFDVEFHGSSGVRAPCAGCTPAGR
jgi:GAF domain-containing protein